MTAKLIDGKAIAASVRAAVKEGVAAFTARTGVRPGLTVVLVGENPASQVYVRNKGKGNGKREPKEKENAAASCPAASGAGAAPACAGCPKLD